MKKQISVLALGLSLVVGAALAGCSAGGGQSASGNKSAPNASQEPAPAAKSGPQVFRANLTSEPSTADPGLAKDATSGAIVRATFDGLTRLDKDSKPMNSIAEDVKISDDRLTYTFTLRDAKWSNGDPVTAHDFEFAWKRVLDPKLAAEYAYQLYYIKNAEKVHANKLGPDELGVKALDDKTLQVTLENPTPYFLELTAFYTYYPVNKKVVEANPKWAMEAATHVGNGPFKMTAWEHKAKIVLEKNENYWEKDVVKLDKIEFFMIEDDNTALSMFENDELDWAGQPFNGLPTDAIPALKESGQLVVHPKATMYWYKINTTKPPLNNVKIRKALALAVNRQAIVDNVTQVGQVPTMGLLPQSMILKPDGYFKDNDVETAKKLLEEGMKELGVTKLPPITLSYNTSDRHKKIAEAVQDQWKQALGIDVKLLNKEFKVYLQDLHELNYDIGRLGWNADFNDPINYLEMFREKDTGNNDTGWENSRYKELLIQSATAKDAETRKQMFAEAEQIFMDEMPIIPLFTDVDVWVQKEKVKGVQVDGLGFVDLKWAEISE
ncbi:MULTISPECIES: peptide ABC transporter substrate-binding protein [Brevibacillus]|jgi:oligopeptide transport system substrate-binding protein|uniref:peptide ABC transporter substrate-binding protein n=1 Tax=Brevibacillus TaxID=55080 RepID=UPI00046AE942|nr:peptide ABC transporter substrate-binding protein [Brevibacillus borstelensis]MCM3593505.1 peptide ABC transporter substrate-binding protein [Brevibacillus borstelensis]MED1851540.1 peptide ABC transporter substrate-binding protein [Brevibacillus borstelensis]